MSTIELTGPTTSRLLTRRERVVLSNLSEDVTLEQIATKLFVTRNTVKSQVRSVYRKIGVSSRAEAVAWARQAGLGIS
ncbi:LuxR C-terminal-related transcriptional regulator [Isoptericola sp. NPDC057653]|uniref:helix-turn-helix domain-containing protein n=1 Tax=unclassified Isoptericola TaxID=2623355 RepID=UPI00369DE7BB